MTKKDICFKVLFYLILSVVFIFSAAIVIIFASGYKIDIKNKDITQTGIIIVETSDNQNQILVDDKQVDMEKTVQRNLIPGFYNVQIKKDNYQTYKTDFYLNPGEAKILDNIVLFLEKPKIEEFTEDKKILFDRLSDTSKISISNNELFINGRFVTRFENPIQDASWYPNDRFLGITVNNSFQIIDIETLNHFPLFEKKSNKPVIFIDSGRSVLFESDGKIYTALIR